MLAEKVGDGILQQIAIVVTKQYSKKPQMAHGTFLHGLRFLPCKLMVNGEDLSAGITGD
jgi:hypothetical protein